MTPKELFIIWSVIFLFLSLGIGLASAQTPTVNFPVPCIQIPGFPSCPSVASTNFGDQIIRIYSFAVGIVGIVAVGTIVVGAIQYALSGGNPNKQTEAKSQITAALWGIALLLGSYLILNTVNPRLTSLTEPGGPRFNPRPYSPSEGELFDPKSNSRTEEAGGCTPEKIAKLGCRQFIDDIVESNLMNCLKGQNEKFLQELHKCNSSYKSGGGFYGDIQNPTKKAECAPYYINEINDWNESKEDYYKKILPNYPLNRPPYGDDNYKWC